VSFACPHGVEKRIQPAAGRYLRVLLPDGTRCSVARICEGGIAGFLVLAVNAMEFLMRQEYLAADFDQPRQFLAAFAKLKRYRPNSANIGCNILARRAVSPCCGGNQATILIRD